MVLAAALLVGLGGCGDSLKKPTGLESNEGKPQTDEQVAVGDADEELPDQDHKTIERSTEDKEQVESSDEKGASKSEQAGSSGKSDSSSKTNDSGEKERQSKHDTSSSEDGKASDPGQSQSKSSTKKSDSKKENTSSAKQDKKQKQKQDKKYDQKQEKKDPPKKKDSKSEDEKPAPPPKPSKPSVTHSIVIAAEGSSGQQWCKDNPGKGGCPTDGSAEVPLPPVKVDITEEETVLDVLIRVTRNRKIQMDYRGGQGATAYVEGMRNVYEFDRGQGSGWMYRINGVFPDRGQGLCLCVMETE
nr:DUF4430 domain-containing protein [Lentibacillus sp. JNUCC-1]